MLVNSLVDRKDLVTAFQTYTRACFQWEINFAKLRTSFRCQWLPLKTISPNCRTCVFLDSRVRFLPRESACVTVHRNKAKKKEEVQVSVRCLLKKIKILVNWKTRGKPQRSRADAVCSLSWVVVEKGGINSAIFQLPSARRKYVSLIFEIVRAKHLIVSFVHYVHQIPLMIYYY